MSFEAIIPNLGSTFDGRKYQSALEGAIDDTLRVIERDFSQTVSSWNKQPEFITESAAMDGDDLMGQVYTTNEVYFYVTRGTRPHDIYPRTAKVLHFLSGYKAKTAHRIIGSHQGGASGEDVFAKGVHHPGNEARDFDKEISDRRQSTLQNNVIIAIQRASRG